MEIPRRILGLSPVAVRAEITRLEGRLAERERALTEKSEALREALAENDRLKGDLGRQYHDQEEISATLLSAQKTADETRREAYAEAATTRLAGRQEAEQTVEAARLQAQAVADEARGQAAEILERAHERAAEIVGDARDELTRLRVQADNLRQTVRATLRRVNGVAQGLADDATAALEEFGLVGAESPPALLGGLLEPPPQDAVPALGDWPSLYPQAGFAEESSAQDDHVEWRLGRTDEAEPPADETSVLADPEGALSAEAGDARTPLTLSGDPVESLDREGEPSGEAQEPGSAPGTDEAPPIGQAEDSAHEAPREGEADPGDTVAEADAAEPALPPEGDASHDADEPTEPDPDSLGPSDEGVNQSPDDGAFDVGETGDTDDQEAVEGSPEEGAQDRTDPDEGNDGALDVGADDEDLDASIEISRPSAPDAKTADQAEGGAGEESSDLVHFAATTDSEGRRRAVVLPWERRRAETAQSVEPEAPPEAALEGEAAEPNADEEAVASGEVVVGDVRPARASRVIGLPRRRRGR